MVSGYMATQNNRVFVVVSIFCTVFAVTGCAGIGLTLLGVGAGVTTGTSVAYSLDGVAYKTFTAPLPQVESATRTALDRMGIKIEATSKMEQ